MNLDAINKSNHKLLAKSRVNKNYTRFKVRQYDKNGNIINIFANRYNAARWILDNGLTKYWYKSVGATRACIAGALTLSITKNHSCYGFYWELLPPNSKIPVTIEYERDLSTHLIERNGRTVIIDNKKMKSIKSAAIMLSVESTGLGKNLRKEKTIEINGKNVTLQRKSPKKNQYMKNLKINIPVVAKNILTGEMVKFASLSKGSDVFGLDRKTIKKSISNKKPVNNIQWKLLNTNEHNLSILMGIKSNDKS